MAPAPVIYAAGCVYRLKRDYAFSNYVIPAGGGLFCVHRGTRTLFMRAKIKTEDNSFKSIDLTIPLGVAEAVLEVPENNVVLPFDLDPLTWYGKRIELVRDIPANNGTILPAGTPGLEVLGSEGADLIIGWRASFKPEATGEFVDNEPVIELVPDSKPTALARVPVSLFWILPLKEVEKVENSPVGEEQ